MQAGWTEKRSGRADSEIGGCVAKPENPKIARTRYGRGYQSESSIINIMGSIVDAVEWSFRLGRASTRLVCSQDGQRRPYLGLETV